MTDELTEPCFCPDCDGSTREGPGGACDVCRAAGCETGDPRCPAGIAAENIRAAAPDLVIACREALAFFEVCDDGDASRIADLLRGALAKAEGR